LELKFKTSIGPHRQGLGVRKKGATMVASMSLGESWLQAAWADDKVARETYYDKRE